MLARAFPTSWSEISAAFGIMDRKSAPATWDSVSNSLMASLGILFRRRHMRQTSPFHEGSVTGGGGVMPTAASSRPTRLSRLGRLTGFATSSIQKGTSLMPSRLEMTAAQRSSSIVKRWEVTIFFVWLSGSKLRTRRERRIFCLLEDHDCVGKRKKRKVRRSVGPSPAFIPSSLALFLVYPACPVCLNACGAPTCIAMRANSCDIRQSRPILYTRSSGLRQVELSLVSIWVATKGTPQSSPVKLRSCWSGRASGS